MVVTTETKTMPFDLDRKTPRGKKSLPLIILPLVNSFLNNNKTSPVYVRCLTRLLFLYPLKIKP